MQPATPRRRRARPVPEAPIEPLVADAERLAKGWLIAVIEQEPLSEAPEMVAAEWATDGPRACAAAVRALGSDEELQQLAGGPGVFAGPRALDPLRAVLWSALRSAWPGCEPDQVWDLAERLAVVVEAMRGADTSRLPAPAWPEALERALARVRDADEDLALLLAELVDADRMLAVEAPEECAAVLSEYRGAVRRAAGAERSVIDDGEARTWVIAPGLDREQAVGLGSRIASSVRDAARWRGVPLGASVGVATLGEDGEDAGALIEAAEEAMFAAAACGIEIARTKPGEGSPGER